MNKKIITPLLAFAIISGSGAGIAALAAETDPSTATTTTTQTAATDSNAPRERGRGGHRGHGEGPGFDFGQKETSLSIAQQKELNLLHAEYLNTRLDYQEEQQTLSGNLKTALESADKDKILSAWDALSELDVRMQAAAAPVLEKIQAITGSAQDSPKSRLNMMTEQINALRNASTEEEIKAAIEGLQPKSHPRNARSEEGREMKFKGLPGEPGTPEGSTDTTGAADSSDAVTSPTTPNN